MEASLGLRRKGIESDSALDEKLIQAQISSAFERHKKQYPSAPKAFTYDKSDQITTAIRHKLMIRGQDPTNAITEEDADIRPRAITSGGQNEAMLRAKKAASKKAFYAATAGKSPLRTENTPDVPHIVEGLPVIRKISADIEPKTNNEDKLSKKEGKPEFHSFNGKDNKFNDDKSNGTGSGKSLGSKERPLQTQIHGDRMVTTSYTESLDAMLRKQQLEKERLDKERYEQALEERKRISLLTEEHMSRPTSALDSDYGGGSSIGSPEYFDDFIQYTSQDILYEPKKKVAKLIGRYVLGEVLGEGSYGKVKEGFCTETLRRVAVKIMKHSKLKKIPGGEQNVKREIQLLKRLRHENIVELMDVIYKKEKNKIYVVFEYCATTLQEMMSRAPQKKLPQCQAQRYFKQLISGLGYLHANSVIHRDIKPGNLLITIDETVKISDFGVAEGLDRYSSSDIMTTSQGSPAFQPPEVAAGNDKFSGMKVDIWATGVTLFNMISGKFPFDGDSIYNLFENIAKGVYTVPEEADTLLADLISKILEKDPAQRLTLEKIEGHNWLKAELPRSHDEIKVIPILDTPMSQVSQGQLKEELLLAEEQKSASEVAITNISNPNFSYDTTLIPFLENMFEDLTNNLRRSSAVEQGYFEARKKKNNRTFRRGVIAERFLKRLSKTPSSTETSDNTLKVEKPKSRPLSSLSADQRSTKSRASTIANSVFSKSDYDKSCKMQ